MNSKFVESYDGVKIHYKFKRGELKKPTLVFIHGLAGNLEHWKNIIFFFGKLAYPCLAIDLRGHGRSGRPMNHDYYMKSLVRDVDAVIKQEKIKKLVLIGHSIGSIINVEFYKLFPKKVKAFILINSPYIEKNFHFVRIPLGYLQVLLSIGQKFTTKTSLVLDTTITWLKLGNKGRNICRDQICKFNLNRIALKIKIPVLLISSYKDYIFPFSSPKKIQNRIKKDKRLEVLGDSHHWSIIKNSREISNIILKFFEEIKIK